MFHHRYPVSRVVKISHPTEFYVVKATLFPMGPVTFKDTLTLVKANFFFDPSSLLNVNITRH